MKLLKLDSDYILLVALFYPLPSRNYMERKLTVAVGITAAFSINVMDVGVLKESK